MSAKKDEVIHVYDGIQECDNALPKWWLYILYLSIAFAFWYLGYYFAFQKSYDETTGEGFNSRAWSLSKLESDIRANTVVDDKDYANLSPEELKASLLMPDMISAGGSVYKAKCAVCHGNEAQGVVGPNLTDNYWIHGGSPEQIQTTLLNGVAAKGMPAWKGIVSDKNIVGLIAYIKSVNGSNPKNPKAPQGDEYIED